VSTYTLNWLKNNPEEEKLLRSTVLSQIPDSWGEKENRQIKKVIGVMLFFHHFFNNHEKHWEKRAETIDKVMIWEFIQVNTIDLKQMKGIGKVSLRLVKELRKSWGFELGPWQDKNFQEYFLNLPTASFPESIHSSSSLVPLARVRELHQNLLASHASVARLISALDSQTNELTGQRTSLESQQTKIKTAIDSLSPLLDENK